MSWWSNKKTSSTEAFKYSKKREAIKITNFLKARGLLRDHSSSLFYIAAILRHILNCVVCDRRLSKQCSIFYTYCGYKCVIRSWGLLHYYCIWSIGLQCRNFIRLNWITFCLLFCNTKEDEVYLWDLALIPCWCTLCQILKHYAVFKKHGVLVMSLLDTPVAYILIL